MNIYMAEVKIQSGEFEKTTRFLIKAPNHSYAQSAAIYCESHDPANLDWSENSVEDMGGEFAYSASVTKVPQQDVDVLLNYMSILSVTLDELLTSGNYKEYCYVEPASKPQSLWEEALAQATKLLVESGPSNENFYANFLFLKNYDSKEIPNCVILKNDSPFRLHTDTRNVLLEQIEYLAKGIESSMMYAMKDNHHSRKSNVSNWIKKNIGNDLIDTLNKGLESDIWYDAREHNDDAATVIDDVQCAMSEIALRLKKAITQ